MQSVNTFSVDKPEGRLDVAQALRSKSGNEPDELILKRATAVPWSEGEDGWHLAS